MNDSKNPNPEAATPGEDSGILDLQTLAARYERVSAGRYDDLMAPAWVAEPILGRPPAPRQPSRRMGRFVSLLTATLFALGGVSVAFAAVRVAATWAGSRAAPSVEIAGAVAPEVARERPESTLEPKAAAVQVRDGEPEIVEPPVTEPRSEPDADDDRADHRPARSAARPRRASTRTPQPTTEPEPPPTAPSGPAHRWDTGGQDGAPLDRGLDELLNAALGGAPDTTPSEVSALSDAPTARQVQTTLRALEGEIHQCAESGAVTARIVIAGPTGRVTSAEVDGSPQAACMERVLRTARFPRFTREAFTVRYPYRW